MIGRELSVRFFSPPDPENSRNCNSTNSVTSILVSLAAAALRDDTRPGALATGQRRRRRQRGRQKSNRFVIQQNNNFASASRFFVHFFTAVARKYLIASYVEEYVNKRRRISFSLTKLEINSREIRLHLPFSANWNKRDKVEQTE